MDGRRRVLTLGYRSVVTPLPQHGILRSTLFSPRDAQALPNVMKPDITFGDVIKK